MNFQSMYPRDKSFCFRVDHEQAIGSRSGEAERNNSNPRIDICIKS
jgi:hypothetical protein